MAISDQSHRQDLATASAAPKTPTTSRTALEKNEDFVVDPMEYRGRNDDYITTSTPTQTSLASQARAIHNHNITATANASIKNASNHSMGTPNRSGNSSRNSYSMRSQKSPNDSRSFDNSPFIHDSPINTSHRFSSHEKTRERGNPNSPVCLSEFVTIASTPTTTSTKIKRRRSTNTSQDAAASVGNSSGSGAGLPSTGATTSISAHKQQQQMANMINRSSEKDFPAFTPKGKVTRTPSTMPSSTPSPQPSSMATATITTTPKSAKPVKRVVPTLISNNRNEFTSSAFRSDNNLLDLSHGETDISRDILKTQKDVIRQVFMEEKQADNNARAFLKDQGVIKSDPNYSGPLIDLSKITNEKVLLRLIQTYSLIFDLNLVTNILNEISFLVNLINLDSDPYSMKNAEPIFGHHFNSNIQEQKRSPPQQQQPNQNVNQILDGIFKNVNNCIYFGIGVLKYQKHTLCLLDTTSMKVLLENERINRFGHAIKDELFRAYAHKTQLELSIASQTTPFKIGQSFQVFYQQEHDTKINFPSSQEFTAFKKQRDAFYMILR